MNQKLINQIPFEHERRFHLKSLSDLPFNFSDYPMAEISQGYLEDLSGTRIRDEYKNNKHIYTKTIKTGKGVSRLEDESEIAKDEFDLMWQKIGCALKKSRYFIDFDGFEIQLNIFHGNLFGYVQIEVEFHSNEAAFMFVPPVWLGPEVTNDSKHGNYSLAKNGAPK